MSNLNGRARRLSSRYLAACVLALACSPGFSQTADNTKKPPPPAKPAPARPTPVRPTPVQQNNNSPRVKNQPTRPASAPPTPVHPAPLQRPPAVHPPGPAAPKPMAGYNPPQKPAVHSQLAVPSVPVGAKRQALPSGGSVYSDRSGNRFTTDSRNRVTSFQGNGVSARYGRNGSAVLVRSNRSGMATSVIHGPHGERTVETITPTGRVVSYGPNRGFSERAVPGRPGFLARTYVNGNSRQVRVYRQYSYLGHPYYRYVPAAYFQPAFYSWVATPWPASVGYGWGVPIWGGLFGAYFTPYATYSSPDLWLADYTIRANLMQAYAEEQGGDQPPPLPRPTSAYTPDGQPAYPAQPGVQPQPPVYPSQPGFQRQPPDAAAGPDPSQSELSPDVKLLLAREIRSDVGEMQVSASVVAKSPDLTPLPPDNGTVVPEVLKPVNKVFQVSTDLNLEVAADQSCVLTPGDVIMRTADTPDNQGKIAVVVVGRKSGDCDMNTKASVELAVLEDINNQFQVQLQDGMRILAAKAGKGGFPPSPAPGQLMLAAGQAPAEDVSSQLQMAQQNGQQADADAAQAIAAAGQ